MFSHFALARCFLHSSAGRRMFVVVTVALVAYYWPPDTAVLVADELVVTPVDATLRGVIIAWAFDDLN